MVPKPDGLWRPCGNFRRLNDCMDDDRYPLPHIQYFGSNLHGNAIFSMLDLQQGYHQIPMNPADVKKTAYEIASCLVGSEMCIRDRPRTVSPPDDPVSQ